MAMNRSLVIVETLAEQPITDEYLHEADRVALPCFQTHNVTWRYSLLSHDRLRMLCTFDAPDAGSVRDSYAKLGVDNRLIWSGALIAINPASPQATALYVMEGRYPALSETDWQDIRDQVSQCCVASGITWLRSYLSLDRTRVIYEFDAPDPASLQLLQRPVDRAVHRIWAAQRLLP
jgi:hypothetical protein